MKKIFLLFTMAVLFVTGVWAQNTCPQPFGLTATPHIPEWNNVQLNWQAPLTDLSWVDTYTTRIGMDDSADFIGAVRFSASFLAGYAGQTIDSVSFAPGEDSTVCTYTIMIWQGGSIVDDTVFTPGTLLVEQVVDTAFTLYQLNTFALDNPVTIDGTQEIWIGIRCTTSAGYPLGAGNNGAVFYYGDLLLVNYADNDWTTFTGGSTSSSLVNYNWLIVGELSGTDAELSSYNIYRNEELLVSATTSTSYLDSVDFGSYEYGITAVYENGCESAPATVNVNIIPNPCLTCLDTVQVGNGTTETYSIPINTYYKYSFSEQIYTASELGTINGAIPCIAYQYINNTPQEKNIVIYMGNTTKNSFSGSSDWIPVNNMFKVFEGTVNFHNNGEDNWLSIPLDIPFEYDGSSNIVVAVLNNTGSYLNSESTFNIHSASSKTLYVYQDGSAYNVNALPSGTVYSSRNNIRFMIGEAVSCPMPAQLTVSEITTESAVVTWSASEDQSGFEYVIVPQGNAPESGDPAFTSDTTVLLSDLADGTNFTVYVRANCGSDNSNWISFDFMTLCLPLTELPYTMKFDGMGSGSGVIPDCWTTDVIGGNSEYPYISTSYHHSGSASLYFYSYSATNSVIRGQGLDLTENTEPLMMKYYAYKTSAGYGYMQAGYMTDPVDFSSFVCLKTIYSSDYNMGSWYEVKFPLPESVNGQVIYPVLYCPAAPGSTSNYVYVDDISIYAVDGICMAPNNLAVTNVTGTSALVSWLPDTYASGDETYTIQYAEAGTDNWQTETTTSTHYHIGGLEQQTSYVVMVFVNCDNNLYSDTLSETFTTHCLAGGELEIGNGTTTSSYLPDYCFYNYCYTQQIYLASEMNGASPITSIAFNATTINTTPRHLSIYLMHTTEASSDWLTTTNAQLVYNGSTNLVVGWNTFYFTTPFQYNGTDNLAVIVIDSTGSYSTSNSWSCHTASATLSHYIYQDSAPYSISSTPGSGSTTSNRNNVKFGGECDSTVFCIAPNLVVEGYTNESVTLSWTPGYQETSWEMEYTEADVENWNAISASTSPVVVDNLEPNTTYTFRIRSACGGSDYSNWVTATVTTICDYIEVPYSQDFESDSVSGAGTMASCWHGGTNSTTAYPYISTSYAQSGSRSLYFYGTSTYYSYATLPRFADDVVMDSLVVNFSILATTASYSIEFGVMTDAADISTFVPLGAFTPGIEGMWKNFEINTSNYAGNGHYLAFRIPAWGTSYIYLDDVNVNYILPCSHPTNLIVQNVTHDEATITWTPGGEEAEWEYVYGPVGMVDPSTDASNITGEATATLTGLTENTVYEFYVRSLCSAAEISAWEYFTFQTECMPLSELPYTQNFDSMCTHTSNLTSGLNNLSDCWKAHNDGTSYSTYPYVYYSSTYAASGDYSLQFYTYTSSAYSDQYAILPSLDTDTYPINTLQLTFDARRYSTSYPFCLLVGAINGTDIDSFEPIDTILISTGGTNYETQVIFLSTYNGTGDRIALMAPANIGDFVPSAYYNEGHIDNLTLSVAPTCPQPTHIAVDNVTENSVTLSWLENGDASNWIIEYGPQGFTLGNGTTVPANTNPFTVSNLAAATTYSFYVKADCGSGDESVFTGPVSATPGSYLMPATGNNTITTCAMIIYDDGGIDNNYSMNCNSTLIIQPETAGYAVTIQGTANIESSFDHLKIYDGAGTSGTMLGDYSGQGLTIPLLTSTTGPLTLLFTSDVSVSYSGFELTVACASNSCPTPTNLAVNSVSATSVTLDWQPVGSETSWEVAYGTAPFDPEGSSATIVTASTHPFEVQNLNSATSYLFSVRAICSSDDQSTWSSSVSGTTQCAGALALPYTEDFDSYTGTTYSDNNGIAPACWTTYSTNTTYGAPHIVSSGSYHYAQSGNSMIFTCGAAGSDAYAALPTFSAALNTLHLNFWRAMESTTNGSTLTVGYVTDLDDLAGSFVAVDTIPSVSSSAGDTISVDFTGADIPTNGNICFHWNYTTSYYSCCIDDINVTTNGSSPVITDPTVATNAATAIAQTTATLNATITNPDNVTISAKGFEWKTTAGGTYTQVTGTGTGNTFTATLPNLTPNTGYTFKAFITYNGTTVYGSEMTFTTLEQGVEPCNVPTNLHTTAVENHAINIAWDADASVNSWNIQYRTQNGQWSNATSNTNSYNITGLEGLTTYEIQVQANCGSGNLSDWSASITATTTNVGIEEHLLNSITLYPNPANDVVNVQCTMNNVQCEGIEVIDVYGKVVRTVVGANNDSPTQINVSGLAAGMYFVRVTTDAGTVTKTFIKK